MVLSGRGVTQSLSMRNKLKSGVVVKEGLEPAKHTKVRIIAISQTVKAIIQLKVI